MYTNTKRRSRTLGTPDLSVIGLGKRPGTETISADPSRPSHVLICKSSHRFFTFHGCFNRVQHGLRSLATFVVQLHGMG